MKRLYVLLAFLCLLVGQNATAATKILGTPVATTDRMYQYAMSKGASSTNLTYTMVQQFHDIGAQWGVRGDIALCQSFWETGWFKYTGGTAVTPSDHNYCGLGVTQTGKKGCQFSSSFEGITAQLQHLWSYATTAALPSGWTLVDPRFNHGRRGSAPYWENLGSGNWASAAGYGTKIIGTYNEMMAFSMEPPSITLSPESITLTVNRDQADVKKWINVTAKNLPGDIRIASVAPSKFKPDRTSLGSSGGGFMINFDTSVAGTFNGYVALESGSGTSKVRKELNISFTVKAPEPGSITFNKSSLNVTVEKGAASPTQYVTVTGKNLTGDMTIVTGSSKYTYKTSNWNARTGGTIVVDFDTSAKGTYNSYIAIESGSGTSKVRAELPVNYTVTDPAAGTLTATPASITASGDVNTTIPSQTITVKGVNLTGDITVTPNSSKYTCTKGSNWNARTGGSLVVSFNSSAAGSYSGKIVLESGEGATKVRTEIPVTLTVTTPGAKNPVITVNQTSLTLETVQGTSDATADVTVTATDLITDISYSVSGDAFTVTPAAGWNARTGGKLTVALKASKAAGKYNGALTLISGSATAQVALNGTVNAGSQGSIPELNLAQVWNFSETAGNKGDYGSLRNIIYYDGKIYGTTGSAVKVYDARTGAYVTDLNVTGISGGTLNVMGITEIDGKIYVSTLAGAAGKYLKVYRYDSTTAAPVELFSRDYSEFNVRVGDQFEGRKESDGTLVFAYASAATNIFELRYKDGNVSTSTVNLDVTVGDSPRVHRLGNVYGVNGRKIKPTLLNANGGTAATLSTESDVNGTDFATFTYDGTNYILSASYLDNLAGGLMNLSKVDGGWNNATSVGAYPSAGLGTTRNTSISTSIAVNQPHAGCVEAWIMVTNQGMAYFRSGDIEGGNQGGGDDPDPGPTDPVWWPTTPTDYTTDWEYSLANGSTTDYFPTAHSNLNCVYYNGELLVTVKNDKIYRVNAATGAVIGSLQGSEGLRSVAVLGDKIVACNLAFGAASALKVYMWDNAEATPEEVVNITSGHGARCGDLICTSGDASKGAIYLASKDDHVGKLFVFDVNNGSVNTTPREIILKNAKGETYDVGANNAVIEVRVRDNKIYASGWGAYTTVFDMNGNYVRELPATCFEDVTLGTSASIFKYGDMTLMAASTYSNSKGNEGHLVLSDISDESNPKILKSFSPVGTSSSSNVDRIASVATHVDEDYNIHMFLSVSTQGIAKYTAKANLIDVSGTGDVSSLTNLEIICTPVSVTALGASNIALYTIAGQAVAFAESEELDTADLQPGLYIAVASNSNGLRVTKKFVKR